MFGTLANPCNQFYLALKFAQIGKQCVKVSTVTDPRMNHTIFSPFYQVSYKIRSREGSYGMSLNPTIPTTLLVKSYHIHLLGVLTYPYCPIWVHDSYHFAGEFPIFVGVQLCNDIFWNFNQRRVARRPSHRARKSLEGLDFFRHIARSFQIIILTILGWISV